MKWSFEMAKKSGGKKRTRTSDTPLAKISLPRGVRRHLKQLERQLDAAAKKERTRVRKLERARNRRQVIQAALAELRAESDVALADPKASSSTEVPAKPAPRAGGRRRAGRADSAGVADGTNGPQSPVGLDDSAAAADLA
jgi:hypothetical protein